MALRPFAFVALSLSITLAGCAGFGAVATDASLPQLAGQLAQAEVKAPSGPLLPPAEPQGDSITIADDQQHSQLRFAQQPAAAPTRGMASPGISRSEAAPPAPVFEARAFAQQALVAPSEEIITPAPVQTAPFKPAAEDEADIDRFNRDIFDVAVDIRPTEGAMPEDIGAEKYAAEPVIDETFPSQLPPDLLCGYTPWTICYRPLYFEDIALERYGKNVGYLQTGLSGVRFFTTIAALPYKMTRRPPRSCECSNGFSRPGDCPLPGYGNRRLELDAALVEIAAVTAFVYIIP